MSLRNGTVSIVGAGPTGALLAVLLQRRGLAVTLYDSRPDPRSSAGESGRSINLALADRGMHALEMAGVLDGLASTLIPMRGRFVHQPDGTAALQPYGQRPGEVIYSISRQRLNAALLDSALRLPGVEAKFEHRMTELDFGDEIARFEDLRSGREIRVPMRPLLAADGAGSLTRRRMAAAGLIEARDTPLEHGYKELTIPADPSGGYRMEREALHIWPRGGYMLIALPNGDGSFTATLFLPAQGPSSFASLNSPQDVDGFLTANFPDVRPLMPDCVAEFERHPTGFLGTVYSRGWHVRSAAALIGDAAHAIVPFHGQGMNCCFEDCVEFDACAGRFESWEAVFAEFFARRKPNTDAIAEMALENYLEMRERVADPGFLMQRSLALELERRFPDRFIPRYSMVMFHHEIPYRVAARRGAVQSRLLEELCRGVPTLGEVDYARAEREIESQLAPIPDLTSVRKV
ncbi:MAG TPA: NAD(P)/FAD-dependent oxidoreductase [Steroidobacteraceae bacterium]|nr:NAD(P)/FAD-dependent oxidoreductase [Steroidobacteraceae bacterium]